MTAPHFAQFTADLQYTDLPSDVLRVLRRSLLDTIGVAAIGSTTQMAGIARKVAPLTGGAGATSARILMDGTRVSTTAAAMAGAMTIDSVDAHDGTSPCKGHVGSAVFPALFAFADGRSISGAEFATLLAAGYEISNRAGLAQHATCSDYHTSGAWTAIGVAAAYAKGLGCNMNIIRQAAGIAEYHGPRSQMMRCIDHPIMAKDGSCWGALSGFSAALLAKDGFTGAPAVTMFNDDVADIWSDLGERFYTFEQYIKPYPICRWAQPAVEGVLHIKVQNDIDIDQIKSVNVHTFHEAKRLHTMAPKDTDQAQYSLPFSVACALRDNTVSVKAITDELNDPFLLELSHKVNCIENDKYNDLFPAERWAHVIIEMRDGSQLKSPPSIARGNTENPLTDKEVKEKYFDLALNLKTQDECDRIFNAVMSIETEPSSLILTKLL